MPMHTRLVHPLSGIADRGRFTTEPDRVLARIEEVVERDSHHLAAPDEGGDLETIRAA
jgi:hypothetical protein